jgi:hypothetical protein
MQRLVLTSLLSLTVAAGAASAAPASRPDATAAAAPAQPRIVGSPVVRFSRLTRHEAEGMANKYIMGGVVRFDRRLSKTYGVVVAPKLRVGQRIGDNTFGGSPPGHVGKTAKQCYNVEMIQPEPTHTPKRLARWVIGVVYKRQVQSIKHVTLQKDLPGADPRPDARRLGCFR